MTRGFARRIFPRMATLAQLSAFRARLLVAKKDDDLAFHRILKVAMNVLELSVSDLAHTFDLSKPTIERWLTQKAYPHPDIRPSLYKWFGEKAKEAAEKKVAPADKAE